MNHKEAIQYAKEIHAPMRKNFARRRVVTTSIDDLWQADLIEMKRVVGPKLGLSVIDTFSKYAFVVPLKNKSAAEVSNAFQGIITQNSRHPENLQTDRGTEFYNSEFKKVLSKYGINHYSTNSELKASIVERFNRTFKELLFRKMTEFNTNKWVSLLNNVLQQYNNRKHRTIGMTPSQVNASNSALVLERLATAKKGVFVQKFHVGDLVRISKSKTLFDKGYLGNWTHELFKVKKVKNTVPKVYILEDLMGEEVTGTFYAKELQKTKVPEYARIEKRLAKKGSNIKVKWLGYPNKFNSWIPLKDTFKI